MSTWSVHCASSLINEYFTKARPVREYCSEGDSNNGRFHLSRFPASSELYARNNQKKVNSPQLAVAGKQAKYSLEGQRSKMSSQNMKKYVPVSFRPVPRKKIGIRLKNILQSDTELSNPSDAANLPVQGPNLTAQERHGRPETRQQTPAIEVVKCKIFTTVQQGNGYIDIFSYSDQLDSSCYIAALIPVPNPADKRIVPNAVSIKGFTTISRRNQAGIISETQLVGFVIVPIRNGSVNLRILKVEQFSNGQLLVRVG